MDPRGSSRALSTLRRLWFSPLPKTADCLVRNYSPRQHGNTKEHVIATINYAHCHRPCQEMLWIMLLDGSANLMRWQTVCWRYLPIVLAMLCGCDVTQSLFEEAAPLLLGLLLRAARLMTPVIAHRCTPISCPPRSRLFSQSFTFHISLELLLIFVSLACH